MPKIAVPRYQVHHINWKLRTETLVIVSKMQPEALSRASLRSFRQVTIDPILSCKAAADLRTATHNAISSDLGNEHPGAAQLAHETQPHPFPFAAACSRPFGWRQNLLRSVRKYRRITSMTVPSVLKGLVKRCSIMYARVSDDRNGMVPGYDSRTSSACHGLME